MANIMDSITGFLDGASSGDFGQGIMGNVFSQVLKILSYIMYGVIIFGIYFIVDLWRKMNKVVVIRKVTADGKVVALRKVSAMEYYDKKLGITLWKMPRIKRIMPKPELKHIIRWGNRETCEVWEDSSGDLHPCKVERDVLDGKNIKIRDKIRKFFDGDNPKLDLRLKPVFTDDIDEAVVIKPVPQNRKALHLAMNKRIAEKARSTQDWMSKYGAIVVPTVAIMATVLILYFFYQSMGTGLQAIAAQLGQVATSCRP